MRFDSIRRVIGALIVTTIVFACAQGAHAQRSPQPPATEAIVPFTIRIPDDVLTDLKQRLSRARFADEFADAGWNYGTNLAYLKSLVEYWRDTYDWRVHETRLNTLDQFKTNIDGIDIHFIHQRSNNPNARPLLLLNGWPSSIVSTRRSSVRSPIQPGMVGGWKTAFTWSSRRCPDSASRTSPGTRGMTPSGSPACG